MKIQSIASPHAIPVNGTPEHVRTAKAVAAFNKGASSYDSGSQPQAHQQPAQQVVRNQSQVSQEELGAIIPQPNIQEQPESLIHEAQVPTPDVDTTQKPEDPSLSRQFAQLARQERNLRAKAQQQEQQIKAREQAIQAREDAMNAKDQEYKQGYISKADLKANTLQRLAEAEISYDDLTQQMMNTSTTTDPRLLATITKLQEEIQGLKSANEEVQTSYKSAQQQQYDAAIKQITKDAQSLVKNDPNYEIIRATNSVKDVVDLIKRTFDETGEVLSVEEAANEVEQYIEEEALKLSRLSKVTKRLQSVAPVKPPTQQTPAQSKAPQTTQPMRTLTNQTASSRPLTARERALLAFKGEKF